MKRTDANRLAVLEAALRDREAAIARADERALKKLREKGFRFTKVGQAVTYRAKIQALTRVQADLTTAIAAWVEDEEETA